MASALLFIGVIGACILMLWLSRQIEPHWVSKDGERVLSYGQGLTRLGQPTSKWLELRIIKVGPDTVEIKPRRGSLAVPRDTTQYTPWSFFGRRGVKKATFWRVDGRGESSSKRRVVYLLSGCTDPDMPELVAIRMPASSKALPMFEELARNKQPLSPWPRHQGTQSAEAPPDPS
jgi:hypothetical protein